MSTLTNADIEAALKEIVLMDLNKQFQENDVFLFNRLDEGPGERINTRGVRMVNYSRPNASNTFFAAGGNLGVPGRPQTDEMKVFPKRYGSGFEYDGDTVQNLSDEDLITDIARIVAMTYDSATKFLDEILYGDGSAAIGTVLTRDSATQATFASTTAQGDVFGSTKLRLDQRVHFFSSGGTARTAGGALAIVSSKSSDNITVTFDATDDLATDIVATDIAVPENSHNKAPKGLKHIINNAAGPFQGVDRSSRPELSAGLTDAGQSLVTVALLKKAYGTIRYRLGTDVRNHLMLSSPAQKEAYERQGYKMIRFNGGGGPMKLDFDGPVFGNFEWKDSVSCDDDRIYFLDMSTIKKFTLMPMGPYDGDGLTVRMFGASGSYSDKYTGYIGIKFELGSPLPRANHVITNLNIQDLATRVSSGV